MKIFAVSTLTLLVMCHVVGTQTSPSTMLRLISVDSATVPYHCIVQIRKNVATSIVSSTNNVLEINDFQEAVSLDENTIVHYIFIFKKFKARGGLLTINITNYH